jgi:hypothetical protein
VVYQITSEAQLRSHLDFLDELQRGGLSQETLPETPRIPQKQQISADADETQLADPSGGREVGSTQDDLRTPWSASRFNLGLTLLSLCNTPILQAFSVSKDDPIIAKISLGGCAWFIEESWLRRISFHMERPSISMRLRSV